MKKLTEDIIQFLHNQDFVIVSTLDKNGIPHSACKGIVYINPSGRIYLLDVYLQDTHDNLRKNPKMSITAVDGHKFKGYCLKGAANLIEQQKVPPRVIKAWEERISGRITRRLLKNIRGEKGHPKHPEALLPKPEYMIIMDVEEVVDLTPRHLKEEELI
jgi:general stress protein 26